MNGPPSNSPPSFELYSPTTTTTTWNGALVPPLTPGSLLSPGSLLLSSRPPAVMLGRRLGFPSSDSTALLFAPGPPSLPRRSRSSLLPGETTNVPLIPDLDLTRDHQGTRLTLKRRDVRPSTTSLLESDHGENEEDDDGFDLELAALALPRVANLEGSFPFPTARRTPVTSTPELSPALIRFGVSPALIRFGVLPPTAATGAVLAPKKKNVNLPDSLLAPPPNKLLDRTQSDSGLQVRLLPRPKHAWVPMNSAALSSSSLGGEDYLFCKENNKPRLHHTV